MSLKGKSVLVTGASYGLGASVCKAFLRDGMKVYGVSRTKPKISSGKFVWIKADLTNVSDLKMISAEVDIKKLDVLVNNAGIAYLQKAGEFSDSLFDKTFDLNFKAPVKLASFLHSRLKGGLLINISSTSDRFAEEDYGLYCASKAALNIFFESFGLENKDIKVLNLLPSYMETPLQHKLVDGTGFDWSLAMKTDDVAQSVVKLVQNNGKYKSGTKIIVVSDKTLCDTADEEKLWYYNVDTQRFKKLK